ncbi:MAG: epoxyqueuosine reductase QueH [Parasporobacterium sp.]|nr:epoxyqueuosine reductase QueH [Parasporobacterium sp.]
MKQNYQQELDRIIEQNQLTGKVPSLLLHSCCGPCSSYVVTYLKGYFDVTVLYYNPNIYPEEEYDHRLAEQARLLRELGVPLLTVPYDHREFLEKVRGYEQEPEGGARCRLCFELRLKKTWEIAAAEGFDYYCTTLTVSPHKNAMVINEVGEILSFDQEVPGAALSGAALHSEAAAGTAESCAAGTGAAWLPSDFKKREGYKKSIELSKQYGLYRQVYCGCEFARS